MHWQCFHNNNNNKKSVFFVFVIVVVVSTWLSKVISNGHIQYDLNNQINLLLIFVVGIFILFLSSICFASIIITFVRLIFVKWSWLVFKFIFVSLNTLNWLQNRRNKKANTLYANHLFVLFYSFKIKLRITCNGECCLSPLLRSFTRLTHPIDTIRHIRDDFCTAL